MNFKISICISGLLLLLSISMQAQLSYGGRPMMNNADFSAAKVIYLLPPEDPVYIEALKSKAVTSVSKALEYAVERPIDIDPEFNGEWTTKDNIHIWRAHIISPEAYSIGVLFSKFKLNAHASVFIYSPGGEQVKGAYTSRNNKSYGSFFVGHTPGEEIIVELQTNDPDRSYGELHIGSISHAFLPVYAEKSGKSPGLGQSQDCEIDINCDEGDAWQIVKKSVVHIVTPTLYCTGALINNTNYNGKPYVLTAEHCINASSYAGRSIFYFGYENSECGEVDAKQDNSISGSYLEVTGGPAADDTTVLDFTLVRLTEKPPKEFDVYYAGWDAREIEHSEAFAIHHPNADAKKISIEKNATVTPATVPGDLNDYIIRSNYHIRQWDLGTTEGGSSGCPLFNRSKRIVGVLSGGLAMCGDSVGYDATNKRAVYSLSDNEDDYFSKFSYAWDYSTNWKKELKSWLDPAGTGQLSIGGLSPITLDDRALKANKMAVYPNPSDGNFSIQLPEYPGADIMLEMYNITGRKVYSENLESFYPVKISCPKLESGIYLIKLTDHSKVFTSTIILR